MESSGQSIDALARQFIEALQIAEERGDADDLVPLFHDACELRSFVHDEPVRGLDGARTFWREYLASFRDLRSKFERVSVMESTAVLEWETTGTLSSGKPITYRGVSIVEFEDGRVRSFRTYYDSAALGVRPRPAQTAT